MNWGEIIRVVLPIIIEIIKNKNKATDEGVTLTTALDCWNSPSGRLKFVALVCENSVGQGVITSEQQLSLILAFAESGDDPLTPLFIEKLVELAGG